MIFAKHNSQKYLWLVVICLLLLAYQLVRLIAFINVYGGVEHDSGWFLSVARSLAEQGTYTTMVSTIVDPDVLGDINVDQKFDIQAADGRIWFFTGSGNGPLSIAPNAIVLKIFGTGFWALRAGPLIFYTLFLTMAAFILYRLGGLMAVVLFHAFLFFYPHLSIFLGYEAMGEVPSMFYILWAYLAFGAATQKRVRRLRAFFAAGLVAGLVINAKLITLWSISGIFIWAGILWLVGLARGDNSEVQSDDISPQALIGGWRLTKLTFRELLLLSSGIPLTLGLWELVHLIVLTRLAGFEMYLRQAGQRIKFILDDGSGVGLRIHSGPEFFWDKFFLLEEIAHPQRWVTGIIFAAILLGGVGLLWGWRNQPRYQNLLVPMWLAWLANTAWFVVIAKTGWPRHFWFGLVLAAMLLSLMVGVLLWGDARVVNQYTQKSKINFELLRFAPSAIGVFLLILISWGFISQPHVGGVFLPDEIVPYWREKQINNKYDASLPWVIIPRMAQTEVIDYIKQLPSEAKIYYPGQHKSAEIPPQTGRIHYPLARRNLITPHPADIALIGPSITSPWGDPIRRQDMLELVKQECPLPTLVNEYYLICPIEANLAVQ
jgi:hypothetical protein